MGQGKEGNAWHEFDILAAVVSRYQNAAPKKPQSPEHRISCHRCGNIRKRRILCTRATCPHTFCGRCAEKMKEEHGLDVFFGGCPVCKELCCCNNKSVFCHRKNHCYRKCPATKTNGKQANITVKDDSDSEPYHEELHNIPKPENGQYGIFDLLAAVADMDKTQALAKQSTKVPAGVAAPSSSSSAAGGPRKKAKTGKESTAGGKDVYPSSMLLCEPSYAQYFSSSVPESVGNMQLLNSKGLTAPDSGVDGYTFNNNTMGIIRGGLGGVTDAIALMGQQKPNKAGKFNVGMDPASFTMMSATDPLLANLAAAPTASATTAGAATAASGAAGSNGSASYNRLPSIDNNPFSAAGSATAPTASAGGAPVRDAAAFDQALLDSVRTIQQDPFNAALPRQLPSVPRPGPGAPVAAAASAAPAPSSSTSSSSAGAAPALEPMNLLALVSSITPAATASSASSDAGDSLQASKVPSAASLAPQDAADGGGN